MRLMNPGSDLDRQRVDEEGLKSNIGCWEWEGDALGDIFPGGDKQSMEISLKGGVRWKSFGGQGSSFKAAAIWERLMPGIGLGEEALEGATSGMAGRYRGFFPPITGRESFVVCC